MNPPLIKETEVRLLNHLFTYLNILKKSSKSRNKESLTALDIINYINTNTNSHLKEVFLDAVKVDLKYRNYINLKLIEDIFTKLNIVEKHDTQGNITNDLSSINRAILEKAIIDIYTKQQNELAKFKASKQASSNRNKYLKYKTKYLQLKAKLGLA